MLKNYNLIPFQWDNKLFLQILSYNLSRDSINDKLKVMKRKQQTKHWTNQTGPEL